MQMHLSASRREDCRKQLLHARVMVGIAPLVSTSSCILLSVPGAHASHAVLALDLKNLSIPEVPYMLRHRLQSIGMEAKPAILVQAMQAHL